VVVKIKDWLQKFISIGNCVIRARGVLFNILDFNVGLRIPTNLLLKNLVVILEVKHRDIKLIVILFRNYDIYCGVERYEAVDNWVLRFNNLTIDKV
jgi:hypothetical protein